MIRVNTRAVADRYSAPHEKIIEFGSNRGERAGGLIAFREEDDGSVTVELYRLDKGVKVVVPE